MSIIIKDLYKNYGSQPALKNINLTINKGEIVGFLGPNGAGKSTLMKILTSYLPFDKGFVSVNGFDVKNQAQISKKNIGYLPEHNPLYLDLYVREYLAFNAGIYNVPKQRIDEVISLTKLDDEANKIIGKLSKGYRQRVGLAAALLHNPDVLILDEPTTGLDPKQLHEIRSLITEIGKDKTIFLSTHIMQEVEALCHRVVMIKKGEIVADMPIGTTSDSKENIIEVEFDYKIEKQFFNQLPNVASFDNIHDNIWHISFDSDTDMRPALFDFAQNMGVKILSMQKKNKKLEALFIEKTS